MAPFLPCQRTQDGIEFAWQWAGKGFFSPAFGAWKCDRPSLEVHQLHSQRSLFQATAGVQADKKCQLHPVGLDFEVLNAASYFLVCDLSLFSSGVLGDAEFANGVCFHHSALHGNSHQLPEELGVAQGCISSTKAMPRLAALSPLYKLRAVAELDHAGVREACEGEPVLDMLPATEVSFGGLLIRPSGIQPAFDPSPSRVVVFFPLVVRLGKSGLRAKNLRLSRLNLAFSPQSRRFAHPFTSRQFPFQKPERGIRASVKRGHEVSVTL